MDEHVLRSQAVAQHGLVTRKQVFDAGGSDRAISRRLDAGRWLRLRPGVYVVGAVAPTWHQMAMAAVLETGPGTMLCRRSAARAWGLVEQSGRLQVVVADRRRVRSTGVQIHRPVHLTSIDVAVANGLPVTTVARTLIDLAPTQSALTMGTLVDAAIREHQVDPSAIAERMVSLAGHGRVVPRTLIEALTLRTPGHDPGRSALESRIIVALARHGLPLPERQYPVRRPDGRVAFIDLAYPHCRLAIEADGWAFHGQRAAFDADRLRANELVLLGWSVLRFTSAMTDARICATVARALGNCASDTA